MRQYGNPQDDAVYFTHHFYGARKKAEIAQQVVVNALKPLDWYQYKNT